MICSTNRDNTNTGTYRKSTYSEHYLYRYHCYLIDEVKKMCKFIKQKRHFFKSCNKIKDKKIHTQVET